MTRQRILRVIDGMVDGILSPANLFQRPDYSVNIQPPEEAMRNHWRAVGGYLRQSMEQLREEEEGRPSRKAG